MPFTPAHVAAVLPFMGRRRPRWAVPSALVIGAMVPDALYFVPVRGDRGFTHSLTGVVTLDLVLGLLAFAAWRLAVAPAARDLAPTAVRERLPAPAVPRGRDWWWAAVCVVVGALTHVAWDAFTHWDGWVVRHLPVLREPLLGPLATYKVAQFASGVVGVLVVLWWVAKELRRAPVTGDEPARSSPAERAAVWVVLVAGPALVALGSWAQQLWSGAPAEVAAFVAVTRGIGAGGGLLLGVVLWWWLGAASRSRARSTSRV
ncbi:DUF4184 family protein [Knoellia koreensis]|uniref:DUF4184 family protein n=1 Tax=Knoellia koreensis TaxID=2730921 RepID=A0A849H4W2_9MICO|nr:DUF4184 family protein [Knoellia sp. DB2414S]NNM44810.1 DUF4184 family protein [Knoellia sp. DB2414S]